MSEHQIIEKIQDKYEQLLPYLNEKTRRIWAAIEARSLGWGGISQVSSATGLSRTTIHAGIRLLKESRAMPLCEVDRDEQFRHISQLVKDFQSQNKPVISVDTKKKEWRWQL